MSFQTKREISAVCPGCDNEIFFYKTPKLGEFVTCPECGDMTEVVSLEPLRLDWSSDWDDDQWEDEWEDDFDDDEEYGEPYDDEYSEESYEPYDD